MRPNWVTLERGGVNDSLCHVIRTGICASIHSCHATPMGKLLIRHPDTGCPRPRLSRQQWPQSIVVPPYRTHRPHVAAVEYAGWLRRFKRAVLAPENDRRRIHAVNTGTDPSSYCRCSSTATPDHPEFTIRRMPRLIDTVLRCFAVHAPRRANW